MPTGKYKKIMCTNIYIEGRENDGSNDIQKGAKKLKREGRMRVKSPLLGSCNFTSKRLGYP